jgi:predicted amino acid dehydrogenase
LLAALDRCFTRLAACDSEALVAHLVDRTTPVKTRRDGEIDRVPVRPAARVVARPRAENTEGRWGFVFHPLDHHSYVDFDAGLAGLDDRALRSLMSRLRGAPLRDTSATLLIGSTRIASNAGASAYGEIFALPYTAEELHTMPSADAVALVREAVILARDRGARIVGLGAYSSIVTRNGAWLGDIGVPITTGNGLTVVAAVDIILRAAERLQVALASCTVAIVGATGSIGRALAIELAPYVGRLVLVGNPAHPAQATARLTRVAEDVVAHVAANPQPRRGHLAAALARFGSMTPRDTVQRLVEDGLVRFSIESGADLTEAAIVATATSSPHALLSSRQLGHRAIVCDVSRPANVSPALVRERPDLLVVDGGSVSLPAGRDLGVSFGLVPGMLYACMAETALLALDRRYRNGSLGDDLPHDLIAELRSLAARHEFRVVPARDGRPIDLAAWSGAGTARAVSR